MITTIPLLLLAAVLLLAVGAVSIMTILTVARKGKRKSQDKKSSHDSIQNQNDPWNESGKRL